VTKHRRWILVPLTVAAVGLTFASVAYACTAITGSITTTPASGSQVRPGDPISSTASGLTTNVGTYWSLYFLNYKSLKDSMPSCMGTVPGSEQKMAGPVQQNSKPGTVSGSGNIPLTALASSASSTPTGPALVCWITSDSTVGVPDYAAGTPASELVVLG